jgi:hypothetical protein
MMMMMMMVMMVVWSSKWNENWEGKPKYLEKTCPCHFVHKPHMDRTGIEPGTPR